LPNPEEPQQPTRRCSVCKEVKSVEDFHRGKTENRCKPCKVVVRANWYFRTRNKRRRVQAAYDRSWRGVARKLRTQHGLDQPTSEYWGKKLVARKSFCAICGIPNHRLEKMFSFKCGGKRANDRLSFDHITPGVNDGNYRCLCYSCNTMRGEMHYSDREVLTIMQDWYLWRFTIRKLWWMNTHYNYETGLCEGRRDERTPRMEQKLADLLEGEDEGI